MAPRRWTAAFACALLVPVLVLLAGRSAAAQDIQYGPYLTVERDHFQVNGTAKFLYFVSLFDAVREAALSPARLDEDLNYIKNTLRADGIRVMPNWLVYKDDSILTPTYVGPATDTLFDPSNPGALRASTLAALKLLLEHASSRNLIVDVSFTRETLPSPGMSSEQYQAALVMAARELKPYRNVLFDVQNEFTKNWPGASFDEKAGWMANLRRAVNAPDVDPFRIVVASVESTTAFDAGQFAAARAMGAVAFHDSRNASWYQETTLTQIGTGIRSGLGQTVLPIYLQEPTPWTSQDQAGNFTDAAKYAKEAGIAAWTFHQRAGFNLQTTSFKSRVSGTAVSNLKAELETVRWTVDSQTWGLDTTDEIDYYHLDPLGSVRAVTDQNQVVKERHDYLPFGEEYGATGGVETRRFTGKERDPESGSDYFGARSYMAPVGRFTTGDPVTNIDRAILDPQRWNRYAYARHNPLRYKDPDGRDVQAFTEYLPTRIVSWPWALFFPRHTFVTVTSDVGNYRIELTGHGTEIVPLSPGERPSVIDKSLMRGRRDVRTAVVTRPNDSPLGDFTFERRILARAAILTLDPPDYNPQTANCNGFAMWLIESSGGDLRLPYNAFFPETDAFQRRFEENLMMLFALTASMVPKI